MATGETRFTVFSRVVDGANQPDFRGTCDEHCRIHYYT